MSEKLRIMHTADLHLGAEFSQLGDKKGLRQSELIISCENIFKICRDNKIDLLLLSGDVFENNSVSDRTVAAFFAACEKAADTHIFFAAGNHDPLTSDSPFLKYKLPSNLTVLGDIDECITLADKGVRIYGKSFSSVYMAEQDRFSLVPEDDDFINIMVLHGDIYADKSGVYNPISNDFIVNSKMDYIALGHVHEFSGIKKAGNTYFAYPGPPEPHGFDELGSKGVICGEISKGICNLTFVGTALRSYLEEKIDITGLKSNAEIASTLLSVLKERHSDSYNKNLYKILLTGKIPEELHINCAEIVSRIGEEVFFIKIKDNTEFDIDLVALANESTLKGKFVKNMLNKIANDPENSEKLTRALNLGLKAFSSEVKFSEN